MTGDHRRTWEGRKTMTRKIFASALLATGLHAAAHDPAHAAIVCEGNFQIVKGQPISTPYCREKELARVARSYGWRVSDKAVRHSESTKAQICRAIGYDNRVREICAPYLYDRGFPRFPF